ncbi:MAG: B12-binding domain-containing radical SAM protein [Promethearchaeota archaeon]|jgi:haloalkane dehalogenase
MIQDRILLTTPCYPYPTLPANDSLTDATGQRFTHGDDIFSLVSHTHCFANHILAQNVNIPATLLEYPRWNNFTEEVNKEYAIIGISAFPVHLDMVIKMCKYIREKSPETKILLGSYGAQAFAAQYDEETKKKYVDHVVVGEGVEFLRNLLGEDTDRPIQQKLMPKCGGAPAFLNKYPRGGLGFLVTGLGCPGGCDFCSTTEMFGKKRIELLSPDDFVDHVELYRKHFKHLSSVFVIEEDHFRHPRWLVRTKDRWMKNTDLVENVDWTGFGSVDFIWHFASNYGWDAVPETGIGAVFIGVESKFAGEHGYRKVKEADAREVFNKLHSMGIRTLGAWICGWDYHNHANMYEDLNYFIACKPTYQQLTRLSPFPGTELWRKLKEQGRVCEVPWEDVHFWSGSQKNISLETHETLNLTEYGYDLMYKTWGPSMLRRLEVTLNGYDYCLNSDNPLMQENRSLLFKRSAATTWSMLGAMDRFAPNGVVRRRVHKADERFRDLIGEPTPMMEMMSRNIEQSAVKFKMKHLFDPFGRKPREEPAKRYLYNKDNTIKDDDIPYITEYPNKIPRNVRKDMKRSNFKYKLINKYLNYKYKVKSTKKLAELDDIVLKNIRGQSYGGF